MLRELIIVEITNTHRDEQKELRDYLNENCWKWKNRVVTESYDKYLDLNKE